MDTARVIVAAIGFVGVLALPAWVPLVCIIALALRFRAWEAILMGAFMDLLWLPGPASIHTIPLYTILALVIVWGLEPVRAQFLVS